jgi:hypothetical protein
MNYRAAIFMGIRRKIIIRWNNIPFRSFERLNKLWSKDVTANLGTIWPDFRVHPTWAVILADTSSTSTNARVNNSGLRQLLFYQCWCTDLYCALYYVGVVRYQFCMKMPVGSYVHVLLLCYWRPEIWPSFANHKEIQVPLPATHRI